MDVNQWSPADAMQYGLGQQTALGDYLFPDFAESAVSAMQQKSPLAPTTNASQGAMKQKNHMQEAHDAVMDLMKGGKAIPRGMVQPEEGSSGTSGLDLSQYNTVERDMSGNIIGLSGGMQYDPVSGAPTGKIAPDWKAKTEREYIPVLERKGKEQSGWTGPHSWETSKPSITTPEIEARKTAVAQEAAKADQPSRPSDVKVTSSTSSTGETRTVTGPSGFAKAFIPKKKETA